MWLKKFILLLQLISTVGTKDPENTKLEKIPNN
jgi:hypothetical protein